MKDLLRRWQTETGDAYLVSLVRAILGVLLVLSALREIDELGRDAYFGDVFHLPIVPEALVPSRGVFAILVALELLLAVLVTIGRRARPALLGASLLGLFFLLCDRTRYHNNRYALFLFAFLLAFAPCDRAFVFRRRAAVDRNGPLWAQRLAQVQLSIIYVASGGSKLLDPDWRSGQVIGDRLARSTAVAVSKGVPVEVMRVLSDDGARARSRALSSACAIRRALVGRDVPRDDRGDVEGRAVRLAQLDDLRAFRSPRASRAYAALRRAPSLGSVDEARGSGARLARAVRDPPR